MGQPLLRNMVICEDLNVMPAQPEPKVMMVQPIINFIVPFVPTQLSFSILAAISHFNFNEKYNLEIRVVNDTTKELLNSIPWEVSEQDNGQGIPPSGLMITAVKNMVIETQGRYHVELLVSGSKLGEQFFEVYKRKG